MSLGGFWTNFTAFSVVVLLRNTLFDSGYIFFVSFWMALEEFPIFPRGWVDSDPEVVSSLSFCGHARRQQRQWQPGLHLV